MSDKLLEELRFRKDTHYNNEAEIILGIVRGDLSKEDLKGLTDSMNRHSFQDVIYFR